MSLLKTINSDILKAKTIVTNELPNIKLISVVEYKDMYVFVVEPVMLGLIAVSKKDGHVFGFNPMLYDPEEYFKLVEKNTIIF